MESLYDPADAQAYIERYAGSFGEDLALRVYTSRLLGRDPELVLHGGGNTSVKSTVTEIIGDVTEVLYVKGSGSDLSSIEPRGFPACRLARLRRAAQLGQMSDDEMVAELRGQMIDPSSPTPSVEALLHAILPAKFVDHTHADAVLALVDQPGSEALVREVYGEEALFVPYTMPGFVLARRVVELLRGRPEGEPPALMILDKHGIFTWGATAQESYERMIAFVTRAEDYVRSRRSAAARTTISAPASLSIYNRITPLVRGAVTRASGRTWIARWRATPTLLSFTDRSDFEKLSQIGPITPDHVIRTKHKPLVFRGPYDRSPAELRATIEARLAAYAEDYQRYFERGVEARGTSPQRLDPFPRVLLFEGLGALTLGATIKEAEIAADIYEHTAAVIDAASSLGGYQPVGELDLFDVEYWSLEQAKLKKGAGPKGQLEGRIALVTGSASGIGLATASAMLAEGSHVVLTDRDGERLEEVWADLDKQYRDRVTYARCDVTNEAEVRRAVALAVERYGGLDIVISNAGTAPSGALHTAAGDAALRASLEVNLLGHQNVARAAADVMLMQGTGGVLLFNASKSAFNQGPDFGPYAIPKAAVIALMRQYAVDLGAAGIRANAINADRIRTDLFGGGVLEARAKARGVPVDEYFKANLLHRETTAADVARAFIHLATAEATTGCVITVDGGNAAAFPR